MPDVPKCLQRRYHAVDQLINDLSSDISYQSTYSDVGSPVARDYDPGLKLMCKFWNILKEDPDCNLQQAVQQRMAQNTRSTSSGYFGSHVMCYQLNHNDTQSPVSSQRCCSDSCEPNSRQEACGSQGSGGSSRSHIEPLSQALGTIQEAVVVEKHCTEKAKELMSVQQQLTVQIAQLERKEHDEAKLLKEADAIWTKMENEYKEKLQESKKRQEELLKEYQKVEASASKWRRNKKDVEDQLKNVSKCLQEIRYKDNQKTNELMKIEAEISDLEKRIGSNKTEVANESKILASKKEASTKRLEKLREETRKLQVEKIKEDKLKQEKIAQGSACVKEAREQLAKVCRVLLKKKLENEDLRAEAKALVDEIDLLKATYNQCGDICKNKEDSLASEIDRCKSTIEKLKLKTSKEHASTDTENLRSFCTECPKCQEEMCECGSDKCTDLTMTDCVCMTTKHKFMNNVFDNMYTVLERQINTKAGTTMAEQVLDCLRKSRNGKLDSDTKSNLQNFILGVVKQNLNLTIIGGAVKTRCEMDADTYKKLMLCLNRAKAEKPEKADKGTDARKEPCARWGGSNDCNCPKGPESCVCTKNAPCPKVDEDDDDDDDEIPVCEQGKKSPRCLSYGIVPDSYTGKGSKDNKNKKPCAEGGCSFNSNMRAAQCSLGNDYLDITATVAKGKTNCPLIVIPSDFEPVKEGICSRSSRQKKSDCDEKKSDNLKDHDTNLLRKQNISPIEAKLNKMLEDENKDLHITLLGENGVKADLKAELKKTKSGHMAMDIKDESHVGEIVNKKCPVSLFKTSSGYKVAISKNYENCNAILTKGSTGDMNVVLKEDANFKENNTTELKAKERLFRIRAKNTDAAHPEKTLIRATSRGNYKFILDKEFETRYKKVINDYVGDITYCYVNLSRTTSGTYVIDFGENNDDCKNNFNAILEKSDSGSVLLIECVDVKVKQKQHHPSGKCPKKFNELYKQLSDSEEFQRECFVKQQNSESIFGNRGNALEFDRNLILTFQDQKYLVAELSVSLNYISSGQYVVIFNTESEGLFVANLLTSRNSWLPIQCATKRQVSVNLNRCMMQKIHYGWLKLSLDGEILVEVDKIDTGVKTNYPEGCTGMHREKGVTTSCHGRTDYCDCDKTQCVCDEIPSDWTDWYSELHTPNVQIKKSTTKRNRRKKSGGRKSSDVCGCIR